MNIINLIRVAMEIKFKTRTKLVPGELRGEVDGIVFMIPASRFTHLILIEVAPPFEVYKVVFDFIINPN